VNVDEPSGFKRAINSAWDNLPKLIVAAIVAIAVFVGGFWDSYRRMSATVDGIMEQQLPAKLCGRLHECPFIDKIEQSISVINLAVKESREQIYSHYREDEEWKNRIRQLEQWRYNFSTHQTALPDPFTGTMGKELEGRIERLENGKNNRP